MGIARRKTPGESRWPAREHNDLLARVERLERRGLGNIDQSVLIAPLFAFQISSIQGDYLEGVLLDNGATVTTTIYNIAKPWLLRQSLASRDGVSFTYTTSQEKTATDSPTVETWVVTPSYVVGDIIYATRVANRMGVDDSGGDEILWLDVNVDARAWAQKFGT